MKITLTLEEMKVAIAEYVSRKEAINVTVNAADIDFQMESEGEYDYRRDFLVGAVANIQ